MMLSAMSFELAYFRAHWIEATGQQLLMVLASLQANWEMVIPARSSYFHLFQLAALKCHVLALLLRLVLVDLLLLLLRPQASILFLQVKD